MPEKGVRLGVDFGAGSMVIAVFCGDDDGTTMAISGLSREVSKKSPVYVIPPLVWYENGTAGAFGDAVARAGHEDAENTARWLRQYVSDRSPVQVVAGNGRTVRYDEATADFLTAALAPALERYPGAELTFSLPVGAPPDYSALLQRVAAPLGAASITFTGEYRAAVTGYGHTPPAGEPLLLFSFTRAGMEAVMLAADGKQDGPGSFRVLSQATGSPGCRAVEGWIVQDLLQRFRLLQSDPRAKRLRPFLLYEACRIREELFSSGPMVITVTDAESGRTFSAPYAPEDLERLLADHGLSAAVADCVSRALAPGTSVRTAFLVGEGCLLPLVQDAIRAVLPSCRIHASRALDAVARGAALAPGPGPAPDRIARSYALRYWDAKTQEHHYRYLVHSGTRYPSAGQVARVVISAAYDGQALLGIPLCAMGGEEGAGPDLELVAEQGGGVRLAGPVQDAPSTGSAAQVNEHAPTLLVADPPARKGEPRFECTFTLDAEKNLCVSARDLITGTLVKVNAPVFRLE
ncbi:MAG: hypothetical protein GX651_02535 [Methanomicrobiales archaeon]|nr:hypothetical protein [Methanomicrobiales archaeon]